MTTGLPEKAGLQVGSEAQENSAEPAGRTFQTHRWGNLQGTAGHPGHLDSSLARASPVQPAQPRGPCREQQEGSHSLAPAGLLPGTLRASCLDRNVSETVCPRRRQESKEQWISFTGIKKKKKKNQMPRRRVRRGKNPNCCRIMQLKFHA